MNPERILAIAGREWREIYRDRLSLSLAFVLPVMMMLAFTYGLSLDVKNIPIAVLDLDHSATSRDYIHRFTDSHYFDFRGYVKNADEIDDLLSTERINAGIVVPQNFERDLLEGRPVSVQQLINGTFTTRARTVKGFMEAITAKFEADFLTSYLSRVLGAPQGRVSAELNPIRVDVRYLYNQAVQNSQTLPARLIVLVLLVASPFLTVAGVVREKESGSIYNMYASNTSRLEYLTGKLLPYAIIASVNAAILWAIAVWLFGTPFKGSAVLFIVATLLYVLCTTGIGLVVSVLVRTQMAGVLVTSIVTIIGGFLYSGVLTPINMLSQTNQETSRMLPAMYYTEIVDGVFLRGVGWSILWPDIMVLTAYAASLLALGYWLFSKRPKT